MSLLLFENPADSPVGELMHEMQRQRLASELNAAILTSQDQDSGTISFFVFFSFFVLIRAWQSPSCHNSCACLR
jgi:hypothetical protein